MSRRVPEVVEPPDAPAGDDREHVVLRHLRIGWTALLVFLVLGTLLDVFLGLKVRWYLDVSNATRRHTWTLAHAHGVLLGLVNLAFASTLRLYPLGLGRRRLASRCLIAATVLLPGGFFLGGLVVYGGDAGIGIFLAPLGALFLFTAVALTLYELRPSRRMR